MVYFLIKNYKKKGHGEKKVGNHCSKYICEKRNYYEELIKVYKQITK